jgi:hypothetical protein
MTTKRDEFRRWGGYRRILCTVIGHRYEGYQDHTNGEIRDFCPRCDADGVPWLLADRVKSGIARIRYFVRQEQEMK